MDRTHASGACDSGSNPDRCTTFEQAKQLLKIIIIKIILHTYLITMARPYDTIPPNRFYVLPFVHVP